MTLPLASPNASHVTAFADVRLCLGRHFDHHQVTAYTALSSLACDCSTQLNYIETRMPACPSRLSEVIFTVVLSIVTSAERITHVFLHLSREKAWCTGMGAISFFFASLPLAATSLLAGALLLPGQRDFKSHYGRKHFLKLIRIDTES